MKRTATSEPHRTGLIPAKRPRSVLDPTVEHLTWGLNDDDSARVIGLYKQGIVLMADYNRVQKNIETRQELLKDSAKETDDWDYVFHAGVDFEYDSDGSATEDEQLKRAKFQDTMDSDEELRDLLRKLEAARGRVDHIATVCADLQLCPSFTAIILAKLPRELRDQVYDCLWTEECIESMDTAISFVPKHYFPDEAVLNAPDLPVPRFANATFVGRDFASEAAARYLRVLSGAELDYRYVRAHLERDHFGPMAFAVKNDIRRLVMTIDESAGTIYPGKRIAWKALDKSMNSLLMLKDHQDISVEIYLELGMQWSLAFYQALNLIKPVFMTLREANIDTKILGYDFFSTTENDDACIFSEQLNHYLTAGTPKEWLDMKAKEIRGISRGPLRQRCKRTLRIMRKNLEFFVRDSRKAAESATANL